MAETDTRMCFVPTSEQWKRVEKTIPRGFNMSQALRDKLDEILAEQEQVK